MSSAFRIGGGELAATGEVVEFDSHLSRITESVHKLLDLCAENEIDVPEELKRSVLESIREVVAVSRGTHTDFLVEKQKERRSSIELIEPVAFLSDILEKVKFKPPNFELRIKDGSYTITNYYEGSDDKTAADADGPRRAKQKIRTVKTESPFYKLGQFFFNCAKGDLRKRKEVAVIMDQVNVVFQPGKMYLVLGAPGSGKSTLLKMVADTLYESKNHVVGGEVSIAGVNPSKGTYWSNLVGYIDQIDRLHPYLTVKETAEFAWKCRSGGTHRKHFFGEGPEVDAMVASMDEEMFTVNKILEVLGLARVNGTFVGDQNTVRGVSGGEKKRVTVAEMLVVNTPVICCDEISTGLDAATTFDITRTLAAATRITRSIKIVSLLQPPPETVANFDELIVLCEGRIIYFGPVEDVEDYFKALGYEIPERMDVADWLQVVATKDGWKYLKDADPAKPDKAVFSKHLSPEQFRERFHESELGQRLLEHVNSPADEKGSDMIKDIARRKFQNSGFKSLQLVARRELLLWWRDKPAMRAKFAQNSIMGVVVGTLFFQSTSAQSILGVLFQSMFFCCVGAMTQIVTQFPARSIFYKQQDANFFPTWTYVAARSVAAIPIGLLDAVYFGSYIYFLVGLAINDGASVGNYFLFMVTLFVVSWTSGLFFSVFSSCVQSVTTAQAAMAVAAILLVLFCGFTVQPDVIPNYYIWAYWLNYFSWTFRGLVVNEFDSGKYDELVMTSTGEEITQGEAVLVQFGFIDKNDEPYTFEWAGWAILFTIACALMASLSSVFFLSHVRFATGQSLVTDKGSVDCHVVDESEVQVEIPFKKANLTFKDIHYTVTASTTNEKLELLKGVDGVVEAGKMTALMGSSGAGKTTLMDVLAMRKSTGEITGEICVNGFPQDEKSFRRCMGYVEQFDSQTPELTIRETCDFSAKLRLDENDPDVTPESIRKFVDQTLSMLELTNIENLQVGSDDAGGLSFEQRKRLSIAVELVANVSVIFADEPTSGLDALAASTVMRGLKRIALSGRAVCATIHQPSIAIFQEFDRLLLLRRGGETVFFGDLGDNSSNLIQYFERFEATPKIQPGENPATWMLTTIGAGSSNLTKKPFDYSGSYAQSKLRGQCLEEIDRICSDPIEENKVTFASEFATSNRTQAIAVFRRTMTVFFRSPNYNVTRVIVSVVVGFLFGSVYASQRVPENEADMNSRINSLFISILFLCVSSQNTVLKFFETERNMFYRHKACNMYGTRSILMAYTFAEVPFILATSMAFSVVFYFIMGFAKDAEKFFLFFMFVALAFATFTMIGQMLVSLFRDSQTAQGFGGLLVSLTALFSGILIRPEYIPNFWIFMYWILPGHYIFEGIFTSQFNGDDTPIEATVGSMFYDFLDCANTTPVGQPCEGTASQWVESSFPDFSVSNIKWDALYLVLVLFISRVVSFAALTHLNYRAT